MTPLYHSRIPDESKKELAMSKGIRFNSSRELKTLKLSLLSDASGPIFHIEKNIFGDSAYDDIAELSFRIYDDQSITCEAAGIKRGRLWVKR